MKNLFKALAQGFGKKEPAPQSMALTSFLKVMREHRKVVWAMPSDTTQENRLISAAISNVEHWKNGGYIITSQKNLSHVTTLLTDSGLPNVVSYISEFEDVSSIRPVGRKTTGGHVYVFVDNESEAFEARVSNGKRFWAAFFRMHQEKRLRERSDEPSSQIIPDNTETLPLLLCTPLLMLPIASSVHTSHLRNYLFTILISSQGLSQLRENQLKLDSERLIGAYYSRAAHSVRIFGCELQGLEDVRHSVAEPLRIDDYEMGKQGILHRKLEKNLIQNKGREMRDFEMGRRTEGHVFFEEGTLVVKLAE